MLSRASLRSQRVAPSLTRFLIGRSDLDITTRLITALGARALGVRRPSRCTGHEWVCHPMLR